MPRVPPSHSTLAKTDTSGPCSDEVGALVERAGTFYRQRLRRRIFLPGLPFLCDKDIPLHRVINYGTSVAAMADRRSQVDNGRNKRQKTTTEDSSNPYLAHMYEGGDSQGYENGNGNAYTTLSSGSSDGLTHFKRHATTSALAAKAEDGPNNPFNGNPLSEKYFRILKTRRNLPVHSQR